MSASYEIHLQSYEVPIVKVTTLKDPGLAGFQKRCLRIDYFDGDINIYGSSSHLIDIAHAILEHMKNERKGY